MERDATRRGARRPRPATRKPQSHAGAALRHAYARPARNLLSIPKACPSAASFCMFCRGASCSTSARNISPFVGLSMTKGAVTAPLRRPATKVVVFRWPYGDLFDHANLRSSVVWTLGHDQSCRFPRRYVGISVAGDKERHTEADSLGDLP
jgi:hypothetical protein